MTEQTGTRRPERGRVRSRCRVSAVLAALTFAFAACGSTATANDGSDEATQSNHIGSEPAARSGMLNNQVADYSFPDRVVSIAWSPDGSQLAVSYHEDKRVTLVDRATGRKLWTIEKLDGEYPKPCCRLLFSPNGSRLYTASAVTRGAKNRDNTVSVLDAHDGAIVGAFTYHEPEVGYALAQDMALSRDGKTLYAIPGMTNEVVAFDTRSGAVMQKFVVNRGEPEWGKGFSTDCLVFDEDRGRLWFAHEGSLIAWSSDGKVTAQVQAFQVGVTAMALNAKTGDIVAGGTADIQQGRFPLDSRATNVEIRTYSDEPAQLVRAFDGATAKHKLTYTGAGGTVGGVSISSDGKLIAAAKGIYRSGKLLVWDAVTGVLLAEKKCNSAGLGDVAFSPDGSLLAYVEDNSVKILKIAR